MKTIRVKSLLPTKKKPLRYRAITTCGQVLNAYSTGKPLEQQKLAMELAARLDWTGVFYGGQLTQGWHVYVIADDNDKFEL